MKTLRRTALLLASALGLVAASTAPAAAGLMPAATTANPQHLRRPDHDHPSPHDCPGRHRAGPDRSQHRPGRRRPQPRQPLRARNTVRDLIMTTLRRSTVLVATALGRLRHSGSPERIPMEVRSRFRSD